MNGETQYDDTRYDTHVPRTRRDVMARVYTVKTAVWLGVAAMVMGGAALVQSSGADQVLQYHGERLTCLELPGSNPCGPRP